MEIRARSQAEVRETGCASGENTTIHCLQVLQWDNALEEGRDVTAKDFLEQVRYVDRAIDSKLEQVERLRNESTKATSLVSDMPRSSSPNLQRL